MDRAELGDIESLFEAVKAEARVVTTFERRTKPDLYTKIKLEPLLTSQAPEILPAPIEVPVRFGRSVGRIARQNPRVAFLGVLALVGTMASGSLAMHQVQPGIGDTAAKIEEQLTNPASELNTFKSIAEGMLLPLDQRRKVDVIRENTQRIQKNGGHRRENSPARFKK